MNLRALTVALVVAVAIAAIGLPTSAQSPVRVFVDGDQVSFDQAPVIMGSRVLVPLRGIFEQMGATVEWRPLTRTVVAARGATLVELQIGSRIAKVNDRPVTLDVPAMIIGGRTLVPLRFISESLGARVEWREESRTVLIFSGGQAGPPPPIGPPPQTTTVKGVVTSVVLAQSAQDLPRITIESGNVATTIRITADTAITRVEVSSGVGGSVGVAALRLGDDAEVTLAGNTATRIRATYQMTSGKIEAIARASRTLVMTDGRAIKYAPTVIVLANGQPAQAGADALRPDQIIELRLNPTTKDAWEINIITGAATVPQPSQMTLTVTAPQPGQTVANPVTVSGTTAPGSRVDVVVTWFLGLQVGRQTVTSGPRGGFTARVPITVVSPNSPYLITVTATHTQLGQEQRQFTVTVE